MGILLIGIQINHLGTSQAVKLCAHRVSGDIALEGLIK